MKKLFCLDLFWHYEPYSYEGYDVFIKRCYTHANNLDNAIRSLRYKYKLKNTENSYYVKKLKVVEVNE